MNKPKTPNRVRSSELVSLYRYYNMEKSEYGQPFAVCGNCKVTSTTACVLEKIGTAVAGTPCAYCGEAND
jgi:hypothetical protein